MDEANASLPSRASASRAAASVLTCPDTRPAIRGRVTGCPPAGHAAFTAWMKPVPWTVVSSSVEAIILAGDVDAGDVIALPDARDAGLVKQVRLGQGGFIVTVVPVDDDRPGAERLVTLAAGIRLRKTSA